MRRLSSDVCVIGGGPAGAVVAMLLARLGHDVLVLDREASHPPAIESLSPAVRPLLDSIGIGLRGPAAGRPVRTSVLHWSDAIPQTVTFPEDAAPLLVDRGCFDEALRRAAIGAGARMIRPTLATRVRRLGSGWKVTIKNGGHDREVTARFLVDASGRSSRFAGTRHVCSPQVLALHGIWPDARVLQRSMILDSSRMGWCWGSAVSGKRGAQAIVFVPADRLRRARGTGGRVVLYRRVIDSMPLAVMLVSGSALASLRVRDASVSKASSVIDANCIRVGDASATADPLSSAGVQRAIQSAISGSSAVHTILTRPRLTDAAIHFYQHAQLRSIRRHEDLTAAFYPQRGLSASTAAFR